MQNGVISYESSVNKCLASFALLDAVHDDSRRRPGTVIRATQ
jgi:hypothetical protein